MGGGGSEKICCERGNCCRVMICQLICRVEMLTQHNRELGDMFNSQAYEVEMLTQRNHELEDMYNNLASEHEGLNNYFEEIESKNIGLRQDTERLEAEVNEARASWNKKVQKVKEECEVKMAELRDACAEEKMQIDISWEGKVKEMKEAHQLLCQGLKAKLKESQRIIENKEEERQSQRREITNLQMTFKRQNTEKEKLVQNCEEQSQILRNHMEAADATAADEIAKNEELSTQVAKLRRVIESMKKGSYPQHHPPRQMTQQQAGQMKEEVEHLKKKCKQAQRVIQERELTIKELSLRLSNEMGKKVSADEKCLENINIKNRPMNVATEYENICSSEWLEAKGMLDEQLDTSTEQTKASFLRRVFYITEEEAKRRMKAFKGQLQHLFSSPVDLVEEQETDKSLPVEMTNAAGDLLRTRADDTEISGIIQMASSTLGQEFPAIKDLVQTDAIQNYITACSGLAWKMAIQRPAMAFTEKGLGEPWRGASQQDVCYNSSDPNHPKSKVDYFVHPALWHGNALMVKGRVHLTSD